MIIENSNSVEIITTTEIENEPQEQEGELTVIHIITRPNPIYKAQWWCSVRDDMFIRPVGSKEKLVLVYAHNITILPQKYYFKNRFEQLHFTLFFPALPKDTTHIDIIE